MARPQSEHGVSFDQAEGRTKSEFKQECDVNRVLGKWRQHGFIEHVTKAQAVYGDFTNVGDYMSAMLRVQAAQEAFATLPARVRDHVDNDPAKFIDWALNPENRDELEQFGLLEAPPRPDLQTQVAAMLAKMASDVKTPQPEGEGGSGGEGTS